MLTKNQFVVVMVNYYRNKVIPYWGENQILGESSTQRHKLADFGIQRIPVVKSH